MAKNFRGTGVALVTPFDSERQVDFVALKALVEHVSDGGVDYLVVMGTTAESPTLTEKEKLNVLKFVKENNAKNLPIVYGMGGNNTAALVEQYKAFEEEVDAFLVVCPYYNKPSQLGLQRHYEAIADVAPKPIILYNVPGRTSVNMNVDTILKLADHPNIIGVKEAAGDNVRQITELGKTAPEGFLLASGDDDLIIPFMKAGGHGVISVIANALPYQTSQLVKQCLSKDFEIAKKTNDEIKESIGLIFREGNPVGVKSMLKSMDIGNGLVRLPLVEASQALSVDIEKAVEKLDIKKGVI